MSQTRTVLSLDADMMRRLSDKNLLTSTALKQLRVCVRVSDCAVQYIEINTSYSYDKQTMVKKKKKKKN